MYIRKFIRIKRREEKLTQRQVADMAGVGLRFVRELEQGKETLRIDKVNAVLKLFGKELGVADMTKNDDGDET